MELGIRDGLEDGYTLGVVDGQRLGLDDVGDSDGFSVEVGKEGADGDVGGAGGNVVGPFVGLVGRQPHGSEIASANNCAPTHSDCVSSELIPACSTSRHWMPAMNPFLVACCPDKHNTQKTSCCSSSLGSVIISG